MCQVDCQVISEFWICGLAKVAFDLPAFGSLITLPMPGNPTSKNKLERRLLSPKIKMTAKCDFDSNSELCHHVVCQFGEFYKQNEQNSKVENTLSSEFDAISQACRGNESRIVVRNKVKNQNWKIQTPDYSSLPKNFQTLHGR